MIGFYCSSLKSIRSKFFGVCGTPPTLRRGQTVLAECPKKLLTHNRFKVTHDKIQSSYTLFVDLSTQ